MQPTTVDLEPLPFGAADPRPVGRPAQLPISRLPLPTMTVEALDALDARAIAERWQLRRLGRGCATDRNQASTLQRFEIWCLRHGHIACPASLATVQAYVGGIENANTRASYRQAIVAGHVALGVASEITKSFRAGRGRPNAATATLDDSGLRRELETVAGALLDPGYTPQQALQPIAAVEARFERATARLLLEHEVVAAERVPDPDGEPVTLLAEARFDLEMIEKRAQVLEYLDEKVLEAERRAHAKNTRDAYRARLTIYLAWCHALGLEPYPASVDTVCRFLTWYGLDGGDGRGRAPSTLGVAKAALGYAHTVRDLPDPTSASRVKRVLAGLVRNWTKPPRKARPITLGEIHQLCDHLDRIGGASAVRDKALFLTLFAGCMRRSEATSRAEHEYDDDPAYDLRIEQIEFTDAGCTIHLLKTKTTAVTETQPRYVAWGMDPITCPVLALQTWVNLCARYGRTSGALFPTLHAIGDRLLGEVRFGDRSIGCGYVRTLLVEHAIAAGVATDRLSTHSFRRGHAHAAHDNGAPIGQIKQQGGWRNLGTVGEYIDECTSQAQNSSQRLGL